MVKISFKGAVVKDYGYGVSVNDKDLDDLISIALGTKTYDGKTKSGIFSNNNCDVTVIINPHPTTTVIETKDGIFDSFDKWCQRLEENENELEQKDEKTDPEK